MNNNLETRIKNIAANMEGNFTEVDGYEVPHSKFVEWDQTWDLFEGEDERWVYDYCMDEEYSVTPDSTDEEIEEAIRSKEFTYNDYYDDEVKEYVKGLRDAKFSKDPDAFDEQTVDALVDAFKEGMTEASVAEKAMPSETEIRNAARKVLEQESKDRNVRLDALLEAREEQFHTFGYPSNKWSRPDADKCPVSPEWFDYAGGMAFMEYEDTSLEEGLRKCMLNAYQGWFDENTIRM